MFSLTKECGNHLNGIKGLAVQILLRYTWTQVKPRIPNNTAYS